MTAFVISDHHFRDYSLARFRRFENEDDQDDLAIRLWNETVKETDLVYYVGDFITMTRNPVPSRRSPDASEKAYRMAEAGYAGGLLRQLNGTKILIAGNHDGPLVRGRPEWAGVVDLLRVQIGHHRLFLCHYPIDMWPGSESGLEVMLHGHSHGRSKTLPGRADVGVDAIGFQPLPIEHAVALADHTLTGPARR